MRASIVCEDGYEAQKLASLIYSEEGGQTHITEIRSVIGNEVVIAIKDGSAHSILLRDVAQAEGFADFVQSVLEGRHRIAGAAARKDRVEIDKE